jgi:RNase adaptor protein for sRNA GlmZ degradation
MSEFKIDFFELAFLAEACIPPRPIARTMFWQHLTDVYWEQMTEDERDHLFDWMNMNYNYKQGLEMDEDIKVFHARFNPDTQYLVYTLRNEEPTRAYLLRDNYYVKRNTWIQKEYITRVEKI